MTAAILHLFCLLALAAPLMARKPPPSTDWADLKKLAANQMIELLDLDGRSRKGRFQSVDDMSITIRKGADTITESRGRIREVKLRTRRPRIQRAGIGAALGAGIAFGLFTIAVYATGSSFSSDDAPEIILGATVWGGGIGAAIGALLPQGWRTIYTMPMIPSNRQPRAP